MDNHSIACAYKERFETSWAARKAHRGKKRSHRFVYRCPICDGWHVTSQKQTKDGPKKWPKTG